MAVKPWLGAIRPPKFPPPINKSPPNIQLRLDWVYGYTCAAAVTSAGTVPKTKISNNVFYNASGDIIYPAASIGIRSSLASDGSQQQAYYQGHDDDILCLAISHDRRFVATGQTASSKSKGKAGVCIWDATDGRTLATMPACHQRGVSHLSFSYDNTQLLSVGLDDSNSHIVWVSHFVISFYLR